MDEETLALAELYEPPPLVAEYAEDLTPEQWEAVADQAEAIKLGESEDMSLQKGSSSDLPPAGTEFAEDGEFPTEDMDGVTLMKVGGPYFGKGSPPEGDYFTEERLQRIASDTAEIVNELTPPNKIGHSKEQTFARASFPQFADDDMPALGWVSNVRYEAGKILGDLKRVPAKFSRLIDSGAFRKRSVELGRAKSQTTGKDYPQVIRGLAWLGAKAPAIRTLDDVVALYGDVDGLVTVEYAEDMTGTGPHAARKWSNDPEERLAQQLDALTGVRRA
jgi:hypothetical protein